MYSDDDKKKTYSSSEEEETVQEKKLRLAKQYLSQIEAEGTYLVDIKKGTVS